MTPRTNLQWRCARGHEWKASLRNVKHNKSWCPICGAGVSERICRGIFEALFQTSFSKARPDWLKNERDNWMELDGYSEELGIAFEYHGIQHYEFNPFFHNEKVSFVQRKKDDRRRAELCRTRGIRLFEIPYTVCHEDIEAFVRAASREMGIPVPRQDPVILEELPVYEYDPLEELKKLAYDKGGECLSTVYINKDTKLRWRCSEGHEWEMPAHAVRNSGQWCPHCGIKRRSDAQRLSVDDMRALAQLRGGFFVSQRYEGSNRKHRWRCAEGHEWEAKPNNVKHGSWCPICAGHAPLTIEEMRSIAATKGGLCLSNQYLGTDKKLRWRCGRSHEWEATPYKIKHRNQWCPICAVKINALKKRLTIDEMKSLAQSRGGACLSDQYFGNDKKLRWKCGEGHVWEATPHSIKDGGQWCPQCRNKHKGLKRLGNRGNL